MHPRTGQVEPQLVFEVAVSNETMPKLAEIDLERYFAPGAGTRGWVGVKIFRDDRNTPPNHRWWCGWASRDFDPNTTTFLNTATLNPESMPGLATNNAPLSTPTNIVFHIDVDMLIHPITKPAEYPSMLNLDMERVRRKAVRAISF